jgi:hypothetical protein
MMAHAEAAKKFAAKPSPEAPRVGFQAKKPRV